MPAGVNVTVAADGTRELRCAGPHPTLKFPGKSCCTPLVTVRDGAITFSCCKAHHLTTISLAEFQRLLLDDALAFVNTQSGPAPP